MTDLTPIALWAILIGAVVLLAMSFNRSRKLRASNLKENRTRASLDTEPDSPQPFGYKCAWYVVESDDAEGIAQAIGLKNAHSSNWRSGIGAAYEGKVFMSPVVNGWTFVASTRFGELHLDELLNEVRRMLETLSIKFGEAQYFATHRIVELHIWAKSIDGELVRGFGWVGETGETFWDDGLPDSAETTQGSIDEEAVMSIARAWSIAPTDLSPTHSKPALGLVGTK